MKRIGTFVLGTFAAVAAQFALAQQKPTELKIAMTTFLTGSASVFGIPAKAAAEIIVEDINAAGGVGGVKIKPIFIDEGVGTDKLLSEYRRVVQEEGVNVTLAAISSGNCNALAPVAEDLKVLNVLWDCASEKLLEERRYNYVVRTLGNGTSEIVATVMHLLRTKPNFKTLAIVNQDYAWGRDSRELFVNTLLAMKPDVKVVAEMYPKFGATDFSSEISRLQALKPDVILSTSWGGDLDTLLRQASQRGLLRSSTWVLPLGESSLERLGKILPDGLIVGMRGEGYYLHPEFKDDAKHKSFVQKYRAKTGQYPVYPVYHAAQAFQGVVDAYTVALKTTGGKWPTNKQVADTMRSLKFRGLTREVKMREDGQGLADQMLGVTKMTSTQPFPVIDGLTIYPAEIVQNPVGTKSPEWVKTLTPDLLKDPRIKSY
ncbi:ABC transporter substrate-binding protein [Noviherbaspirillum sp. CPCC 100848]|uniref:ABC transporter substrate-binding protein n=1 Tax=Noviherbaspirillum album TaxID=3080276 RepID=A0ABU6JHC7_9BURK|nr:ABC transporter substrate-binding protein [Noviherbaspirillum sp. CPCC 100848]MEC4722823.1 ABC transporter substrate-binding protein [Noviherbaspirillum sp. CPCC 100848]